MVNTKGNTKVKKGRVYKKTARTGNKSLKAIVRREAKAVIMRTAETKSYFTTINSSVTDNIYQVFSPTYGLGSGVSAEQRIGEKIHIKNIRLKGWMYQTASGGAFAIQRMGRILVIKTKKFLASGTPTALSTRSDVFREGGSNFIACDHVDLSKVDILYDQTFNMPLHNQAFQYTNHLIDINIPINKTVTFEGPSVANVLKTGDYYVLFGLYTNGGITTPGSCLINYSVNFKDE